MDCNPLSDNEVASDLQVTLTKLVHTLSERVDTMEQLIFFHNIEGRFNSDISRAKISRLPGKKADFWNILMAHQ